MQTTKLIVYWYMNDVMGLMYSAMPKDTWGKGLNPDNHFIKEIEVPLLTPEEVKRAEIAVLEKKVQKLKNDLKEKSKEAYQ